MTVFRQFVAELRRRRVIRVVVWYAIAGWVVIQVAATVLPGLRVPDWSVTLVIVLVALGLPLAAVLAWAFDFGDGGLRRAAAVHEESTALPAANPLPRSAPALPRRSSATAPAAPRLNEALPSSIAVLPFANLTGDTGKDFLGEGLAEELIHVLARVPGLKVPSRTSSFAYRGRDVDLRRIATELEVSTVLEGSVRAAGDRIRITAQLIDGGSGYHLWSQHYDRRFEDLFELQDELASAIILQTLNVAMVGGPERVLSGPPTRNLEAYQLFLAAMADIRTAFRGRPAFDKLQAALRLDPDFAKARAFLAHVRVMAVLFDVPLPGTLADADEEALRALEESPESAGVHRTLGLIRAAQGRFIEADAGFRRALALDPSEPESLVLHGAYVLGTTGHLRAQLASTLEALRLAPAVPVFNMTLAVAHAQVGDDAEARRLCEIAVDLGAARTMSPLVDVLAQLEVRAQRYDAARALMHETLAGTPGAARLAEAVDLVFAALAERRKRSAALSFLDSLRDGAEFAVLPQFVRRRMILWYSMLEAYDGAYDVLHRSLDDVAETGTVGAVWGFLWLKELAGFRADPRFAALAQRMHLPDYWQMHGPPDGYDWRDGLLVTR